MSRVWRQTVSDELAAAVDTKRGPLTLQEFTIFALAAALDQPNALAELQRQVVELRAELAIVRVAPAPPPAAPVARSVDLLTF